MILVDSSVWIDFFRGRSTREVALLDSLLGWCEKHKIYAVLDLHAAPGGQSPYFVADPLEKNLWRVPLYRERTIALWKAMAARYKDSPVIAAYDLLNEPASHAGPQKLTDFYEQIIAAIREVDSKHMLFLEGSGFSRIFGFFKALPDENMAFSFHLYTWLIDNPLGEDVQDKMAPYGDLGYKLNVPVWCGEWGENKYEVLRNTLYAFESSPISGWCYWTWKKTEGKYPALVSIPASESWKKVIEYIRKPQKELTLSREESLRGMAEFIEAVKFANCKPNPTLLGIITDFKH